MQTRLEHCVTIALLFQIDTPIYVDSWLLMAKKFGVTEFVNPKDHENPVQEVHSFSFCYHNLVTIKYKYVCALYCYNMSKIPI